MISNICRTLTCGKVVVPTKWFCAACWLRVPADLRLRMFEHYKPGQRPSDNFVRALRDAIRAVRESLVVARR